MRLRAHLWHYSTGPKCSTAPTGCDVSSRGAAAVDITPLPGYPMGGHSIAGRTSRGVWTRLYAKAIYLEDADNHGIVMVSCDLWSIPGGLADRVAQSVQATSWGKTIGRDQIIIAATHTHQSPGNYSTSGMYNAFCIAKSRVRPDSFLTFWRPESRMPFKLLWTDSQSQPAVVLFDSGLINDFYRNRSFSAFVLDPESKGIIKNNAAASITPGQPTLLYPDPNANLAVKPSISVLKIVSTAPGNRVIAVIGFVAVHPTAMSHETEVYQSDIFGIAEKLLEPNFTWNTDIPSRRVIAIFNGPEGDVSTCWEDHQDKRSAIEMGTLLKNRMFELASTAAVMTDSKDWVAICPKN